MKRLLQNKLVVSCLAFGAVGLLGWDFLKPHLASANVSNSLPAAKPAASQPSLKELETLLPPRVLAVAEGIKSYIAKIDEVENNLRDPSAYPQAKPASSPAETNAVQVIPEPPAPPILKAISLNDGKALAVLNHSIVSPGDKVGGYLVESIDSTSVRLKHELGTITLSLRDPRPVNSKRASENLSHADLIKAEPVRVRARD